MVEVLQTPVVDVSRRERAASCVHPPASLPADSIRRLLNGFGSQYDGEQIVAIEKATRDGHLEFLVPEVYRLRIPSPSVN